MIDDRSVSGAGHTPEAIELAAWLDGRLPDEQSDGIETWLATDRSWRRALPALGGAQASELTAGEIERARSLLVPHGAARPSVWRRLAWLLEPTPALALACLLTIGGYHLGAGLATQTAEPDARALAGLLDGLPLL